MVRSTSSCLAVRLGALAAFVLFAALSLPQAWAQAPSAEQIEIFNGLPPEQQQAIMESLGRGGSGSATGRTGRADRDLQFPQTVRPRTRQPGEEEDGETGEQLGQTGVPREPRLKGDDTVLLSLEIRQLERLAPEIEEKERQQRQQSRAGQPPIPGQQQVAGNQAEEQRRLQRTAEETQALEDFRTRVLRRNPYRLDKWGILNVPELG